MKALHLALGALLLAAALTSGAAPPAGAGSVENFAPQTYVARQETVPVRADPGFVYRELRKLRRGEELLVDGRMGSWFRVRGGGWVFTDDVWTEAEAEAAGPATTKLVVVRDGARVRESPNTTAAIVDTLKSDAVVEATAHADGWWQLASGGWISTMLVKPQVTSPQAAAAGAASTPARPLPWVVAVDSANVRAKRATDATVVRRLARGDVVAVAQLVDGWAEVQGGWIRQDMLEPPAPRRAAGPTANEPRRWSLTDLAGTVVEVYELNDPELVDAIRGEMRETGVLEEDWTFMGLTIGVRKDSPYEFRYSPIGNATVIVDTQGQKFANVYARGPIDRMPAHVRQVLDARVIEPGQRFDGLLLFRPTLNVRDVAEIAMKIEGRMQPLTLAKRL